MPGWFGRIGAGVAGGLVGGVVFGILMQMTGALPVVASLVDQESVAVGWALHVGISVFVGATYTLIFGFVSEGLVLSAVLGAFYGIIWWVLGGLTLMPLRLGSGLFVFDSSAWQSLAGHLVYGMVLGLVYATVGHLLTRSPEDPMPAVEPPPPAAAPLFSPPASPILPVLPPAAAPRSSSVTPLSPQARALRQRGRHYR